MIKVLFFGRLKQVLNCSSVVLEEFNAGNVAELRAQLRLRGEMWNELLDPNVALVAVNQVMSNEEQSICAGDEVAFFPPVTGG